MNEEKLQNVEENEKDIINSGEIITRKLRLYHSTNKLMKN